MSALNSDFAAIALAFIAKSLRSNCFFSVIRMLRIRLADLNQLHSQLPVKP